MNVDLFDLERFVTAQDAHDVYHTALQEVKDGLKQSHWMWFVFPQIQGLGHSSMAQKYGIHSLLEAKAYLAHDTLGKRLREMTKALPLHGDAEDIFGKIDAMKLRSCLTLFDLVAPDDVFADFLDNYFNKERCQKTLETVSSELAYYEHEDAFKRNGITAAPSAFWEGVEGLKSLTDNHCVGTLLDLFGRGETLRMLVSGYLWHKSDFSVRSVSNIKFRILSYMSSVFQRISENAKFSVDGVSKIKRGILSYMSSIFQRNSENAKNGDLCNELYAIYSRYERAEDGQLFEMVDAIDVFLKEHCEDDCVKAVIDTLKKDSLCKPIEESGVRIYNGAVRSQYTPEAISSLKADEVFVFGSNLDGRHGGGAARAAINKFGAIWGQGVGLQGQSYAIPSMQGGVATIKPYVDQFIAFAQEHTELFFYVTRIGCGIAGFKDSDIAPLFKEAMSMSNVCLPESFVEENKNTASPEVPQELLTMMYGQVRTLIDLLKALNKQEPIKSRDDARERLANIIERNVRYGDDYAFMALRTIWCIMSKYEDKGSKVDIEQLEKDMLSFHDGGEYLKTRDIFHILYNYSVRKMVKYIQFLNEFRRYKDYKLIRKDLRSIPVDHCGRNDPQYYYSFNEDTIDSLWHILRYEWNSVTKDGTLDNDLLEEVALGRFDNMVKAHGLKETIRLAYREMPCYPGVQFSKPREEGTAWGPVYLIEGNHIEKGCSDFSCWPWSDTSFEMKFARGLLERDKNYVGVKTERLGRLYLPISDYTLPVYSLQYGKVRFESQEEKIEFIEAYKTGRNAD